MNAPLHPDGPEQGIVLLNLAELADEYRSHAERVSPSFLVALEFQPKINYFGLKIAITAKSGWILSNICLARQL